MSEELAMGEEECQYCSSFKKLLLCSDDSYEITDSDVREIYQYFSQWKSPRVCRCLIKSQQCYNNVYDLLLRVLKTRCFPMIKKSNEWVMPDEADAESTSNGSPNGIRLMLLELCCDAVTDNFPLYALYAVCRKERFFTDENERQILSDCKKFVGNNQQRICVPFLKTIYYVMNAGLLEDISRVFKKIPPNKIAISVAHKLIHIAFSLRAHLLSCISEQYFPHLRDQLVDYLCYWANARSDVLRNNDVRSLCDVVWTLGREEMDDTAIIDSAGIKLAAVHLHSPFLAPRIAGLTHINVCITALQEFLTKENEIEIQNRLRKLANRLTDLHIIRCIFGLNTHPELLRQACQVFHFLMSKSGCCCNEDIDAIWAALQKKECARHVNDLLGGVIKDMDLALLIYLDEKLKSLKPSEHTEYTLNLSFQILETIWSVSLIPPSQPKVMTPISTIDLDCSKETDLTSGSSERSAATRSSGDTCGRRVEQRHWNQNEMNLEEEEEEEDDDLETDESSDSLEGDQDDVVELTVDKISPKLQAEKAKKRSSGNEIEDELSTKKCKMGKASVEEELNQLTDASTIWNHHLDAINDSGDARPRNTLSITGRHMQPMARKPLSDLVVRVPRQNYGSSISVDEMKFIDAVKRCRKEEPSDDDDVSSDRSSVRSGSHHADLDDDDLMAVDDLNHNDDAGLGSPGMLISPGSAVSAHAIQRHRLMQPMIRARVAHSNIIFNRPDSCDNPIDMSLLAEPGHTLLWDVLQDREDKDHLGPQEENLAISFLVKLMETFQVCQEIVKQFICACADNLRLNRSSCISLRLLPKLFDTVAAVGHADSSDEVMQLIIEVPIMNTFFLNFKAFGANMQNFSRRPLEEELTARLTFLTQIFNDYLTPRDFTLDRDQLDVLWQYLFHESQLTREKLCIWILTQLKQNHSHAIPEDVLQHILDTKMDDFNADSMPPYCLNLIQSLLSLSPQAATKCLPLLWRIALKCPENHAHMVASNFLSTYYVKANDPEEAALKENEFVGKCLEYMGAACSNLEGMIEVGQGLPPNANVYLMLTLRALHILKQHIDIFRKRYSYHLRLREMQGMSQKCHMRCVPSLNELYPAFFINVQVCGLEKTQLEVRGNDYVGELRAMISYWWGNRRNALLQAAMNNISGHLQLRAQLSGSQDTSDDRSSPGEHSPDEHTAAPPNVTITPEGLTLSTNTSQLAAFLSEGPLRLLFLGSELSMQSDMKELSEFNFRDGVTLLVSPSKSSERVKFPNLPEPPPPQSTPMALLLQEEFWKLLMRLFGTMIKLSREGPMDERMRCLVTSIRAWEVIVSIPSAPSVIHTIEQLLNKGDEVGESESEQNPWSLVLGDANVHHLLYTLQVMETVTLTRPPQQFLSTGGLQQLYSILLSKTLFPQVGTWNDWQLEPLYCLLRLIYRMSLTQEQFSAFNIDKARKERALVSPKEVSIPLMHLDYLSNVPLDRLAVTLMQLAQSICDERCAIFQLWYRRSHCLKYTYMLLLSLLFTKPELRSVLLEYPDLTAWIQLVLVQCGESSLRRESHQFLLQLCRGKSTKDVCLGYDIVQPLLKALLSCLPHLHSIACIRPEDGGRRKGCGTDGPNSPNSRANILKEPIGPSAHQYFDLIQLMMEFIAESENITLTINLDEIAMECIEFVKMRPVYETISDPEYPDHGLIGLLHLLTSIVQVKPAWKNTQACKEVVGLVWQLAFALPNREQRNLPSCKTHDSRVAAFDLLVEMSKSSDRNFKLVHKWISMQNDRNKSEEPYPWDYWPQDERRSSCGFVGLVNLGATCYMATAMQHLFMIPKFRQAVLALQTKDNKYDSVLAELQRLFAFLSDSDRKAYNPRPFCKVYEMDHQLVNTTEQKDMTEFFTDLISKLEDMNDNLKIVVRDLFSGVMSNNVVSADCPHVSTTTEDFYSVRCQVADMKDLYASLDELTIADVLEGDNMYTCSECASKVKAKKRACFKQLPEILSFNTMRYTFNMQTMMKEKVNTRFSFPLQLDMTPYMEHNLLRGTQTKESDPMCQYDLIGVTVHTGTAEGGHYYSFIRDYQDAQSWFSFNDADVKLWDPSNLESECFGGELTRQHYDSATERYMDYSFEKANSAYMLFYQRKSTVLTKQQIAPLAVINPELDEWICEDKRNFLHHLCLFDHTYAGFVWEICAKVPNTLIEMDTAELTLCATQLALRFVLETLIHAKEKPSISSWSELILKNFSASNTACEWLLEHMIKDNRWSMQILIQCPVPVCRQLFEKLVSQVMLLLYPSHSASVLLPWTNTSQVETTESDQVGQVSCITRFLHSLLALLHDSVSGTEIRQLAEYFSLLLNFANIGDEAKQFLILAGTVRTVIRFYMARVAQETAADSSEDESDEEPGLLQLVRSACLSRSLWVGPSLEKMVTLVILLVEHSRNNPSKVMRLPREDMLDLIGSKSFPFLIQQIKDSHNPKVAASLLITVCKHNLEQAVKVMDAIINAIKHTKREEAATPMFNVLTQLCMLEQSCDSPFLDGDTGWIELCRKKVLSLASETSYHAAHCLNWLENNVEPIHSIYLYLSENLDKWVDKYLIKSANYTVRVAAGQLLLSLIPAQSLRVAYGKLLQQHPFPQQRLQVPSSAMQQFHTVYTFLLSLLENAANFYDPDQCSPSRLVPYFYTLRVCLISCDEKRMLASHVPELMTIFTRFASKASRMNATKQALFLFWHAAALDCPQVANATAKLDANLLRNLMFNYIVVDENDRDLVNYNKISLPAYYGLMRIIAGVSPIFADIISSPKTDNIPCHENFHFCVNSIAAKYDQRTTDEIVGIMENVCSSLTPQKAKSFKRRMWPVIRDACTKTRGSWYFIAKVVRLFIESPEDKLFLLKKDVLNALSDALFNCSRMYHDAPATNCASELLDLLKRMKDFLTRTEQLHADNNMTAQADEIVGAWTQCCTVTTRVLLQLLNSFVPPELSRIALDCVKCAVNLKGADSDVLDKVLRPIHNAHKLWRLKPMHVNAGPYFPQRSRCDTSVRVIQPHPNIDMCLNPMLLETVKGVDAEYDQKLLNYFQPYHGLIDLIIRRCINLLGEGDWEDVKLLVETCCMVACEAIPLQLSLFPVMWTELYKKKDDKLEDDESKERLEKLLVALCECQYFKEYMTTILIREHINLVMASEVQEFFDIFIHNVPLSTWLTKEQNIKQMMENVQDSLDTLDKMIKSDNMQKLLPFTNRVIGSLRALNYVLDELANHHKSTLRQVIIWLKSLGVTFTNYIQVHKEGDSVTRLTYVNELLVKLTNKCLEKQN